jgi:rfaE bifunctional protein kinase chain/domain
VITASTADLARLVDLVEKFPQQTVCVLGDFVADEFVYGEISRVSREAPVLILRHRETETLPGGGANAANNLAALGARVRPVSVVGDDAGGDHLRSYFRARNLDTSGIVRVRSWVTPTKTRLLAGWAHTTRQQVLRVDREPSTALEQRAGDVLARKVRERLSGASAFLVSDYGYGIATPERLRAIRGRRHWTAPVTLDSRYRLLDFSGCGITAAAPNEAELEEAYHVRVEARMPQLEKLARRALAHLGGSSLVVTRGRDGMAVFERGHAAHLLPIFGSDQALDVTGAGDTVIAVFSLATAAGATSLEAAQLANYAGGIVVMKRGTATVSRQELLGAIRSEVTGAAPAAQ